METFDLNQLGVDMDAPANCQNQDWAMVTNKKCY